MQQDNKTSWNLKTLGTVATYINGRAFKPSEWEKTGIPIVRIQNLTDENAKYNYSSLEYEEKYHIQNGELLFAWSASLGAHIWQRGDAWLNQHIFRVIPNDDVSKKYLYFFLLLVVSELYAKAHGSGMVHITKAPFLSTPIPIPPLSEQERIVARIEELFSAIDKGVETLHTLQRQLAVYRQAVLKEAFDGNLILAWRKPHSSKKWRMMAIEEFLPTENKGMNTGPFGSMLKKSEHQKSGVPVLGIENIGNGIFLDGNKIFVTPQKAIELNSFRVKQGDVIISRSGTVGKLCTVPPHMNNALLSSNLMKISLNESIILPEFFVYLFQSKGVVIDQVKELCRGSTREYLNQKILKSIQFPIPSIEEQVEIISMLESRLSLCDKIEQIVDQSLRQAEALRQSILRQAFSGELQ